MYTMNSQVAQRTNEVDESSVKNKIKTEKCNLFVAYGKCAKRERAVHVSIRTLWKLIRRERVCARISF